ncbi:MAG: glycosyltransferase [Desulfovibrio sp.]|nr:glycosyltransferase [Desulfovibrio sp.]
MNAFAMESFAVFLPPQARTVVEFGCGNGATGREFLRIQPQCRYVGFDTDEALLAEAAGCLSQAQWAPFPGIRLERHGITSADCLFFHGAFMGRRDWIKEVRRHCALLSEGGQAVFVLGHPGYVRHVLSLMLGRPPLWDSSLTLPELLRGLSEAGLTVADVRPQRVAEDAALRNDPAIQRLMESLVDYCRDHAMEVKTDVWAARHIVRAVRGTPPPKLYIQSSVWEARVTARVRLLEPAAFMATLPGVTCATRVMSADSQASAGFPDRVMIVQRILFRDVKPAMDFLRQFRRAGWLLIYEIDDNPANWQDAFALFHWLEFAGCHAVQVSTEPLADILRQYNPHVLVFPNHLRELPDPRTPAPEDAPVEIFYGALNRESDWAPVMPELNRVLGEYGGRVKMRVVYDRQFFDALETEHKTFLTAEGDGLIPYEAYARAMHASDIALMPLLDTEFNRMKSDLKFIEAAGHGAVALASPTVYASTVRDGRTGFLYANPEEFGAKLRMLLDDRQLRQEVAETAYGYVRRERLLSQHYQGRVDAYRELLANLPELEREADERVKSLAGDASC